MTKPYFTTAAVVFRSLAICGIAGINEPEINTKCSEGIGQYLSARRKCLFCTHKVLQLQDK